MKKLFAALTALFLFTLSVSAQDTIKVKIDQNIKRRVGQDSVTPEKLNAVLTAMNNRAIAAEAKAIPTATKGQTNGVATLDNGARLPASQLTVHGHQITEVNGLQGALDNKADLVTTQNNIKYVDSLRIADSIANAANLAAKSNITAVKDTANKLRLEFAIAADWSQLGTSASNTAFLGTTNDADMVIKRENAEAIRVKKGGAWLVTGDIATGITPESGEGTRMMWIPAKSAFRAGVVGSDIWDDINIGYASLAFGEENKASGSNSVSMGAYSNATGNVSVAIGRESNSTNNASVAIGYRAIASALFSTAIGRGVIASGNNSTAIGYNSIASGVQSTAIGAAATASGQSTFAVGFASNASGISSVSMGNNTKSIGNGSFAMGSITTTKCNNCFAMGYLNNDSDTPSPTIDAQSDRLFQIGNGTSTIAKSNALTILKNGNLSIGGLTPKSKLQVVGLPIFADNSTAKTVGLLQIGDFYHNGDGIVRVVY
jgi:hypothetical protein